MPIGDYPTVGCYHASTSARHPRPCAVDQSDRDVRQSNSAEFPTLYIQYVRLLACLTNQTQPPISLQLEYKMPSLSAAKKSNATFTSTYRPTAVFVGGTSGVGEGSAIAFAKATKGTSTNSPAFRLVWAGCADELIPQSGNAHIIISGRNKESAERIIASFPKTEHSQYDFVYCDATLMRNVVTAAEEIKSKVESINYLVLSQGMMNLEGFTPTSEGIDRKLALHFYGRWKVSRFAPFFFTRQPED